MGASGQIERMLNGGLAGNVSGTIGMTMGTNETRA
jgi:hypothetical protein